MAIKGDPHAPPLTAGGEAESPRGNLEAALATVLATALSLATWEAEWDISTAAFLWLSLAAVLRGAFFVLRLAPSCREAARCPARVLVTLCLWGQLTALLWRPLCDRISAAGASLKWLMFLLAGAAFAAGSLCSKQSWLGKWGLPLLVVVQLCIGLLLLTQVPEPGIDVLVFQRGACEALLQGHDPYAVRFPDIYPPADSARFYGQGISANGILQVGFPYMPLSLAAALPGYLAGDVRYSSLVAMLAAGLLIARARPSPQATLAAILLLFSPIAPTVLFRGWTEPQVVFLLALTIFCYWRAPRWTPYAFGLLLVSKQYMLALAPLGLLLLPRPWSWRDAVRFGTKAAVTGGAVTLPLVLWNFKEFLNSAVLFQFHQPFRHDALSFLAWAHMAAPMRWGWLPFAALGVVMLTSVMRGRKVNLSFPLAAGLCLFPFFALNKQASGNYYYLVVAAFLAALATISPAQQGDSGDVPEEQQRQPQWTAEAPHP